MKIIRTRNCIIIAVTSGILALAGPGLFAQETVRTTVTTSDGLVSEFTPHAMVIRTETAPVRYSFTETTRYVDELGNPVSVELIKGGAPVTVYSRQEGDALVASKVVVKKTPTPGEVIGTIADFGSHGVAIRTEGAASPVRYAFTERTQYVDASGNIVSREAIRSGTPVTIAFVRAGDRLVANKVTIRSTQSVPAVQAPSVVEERTTTTTTTKEKESDDDDD